MLPRRILIYCLVRSWAVGTACFALSIFFLGDWLMLTQSRAWYPGDTVYLPFGLVLLPALLVGVYYQRVLEQRSLAQHGVTLCGHCGSALRGLERPTCTECGTEI